MIFFVHCSHFGKRAECSIEPKLETGCVWGCGVTTINESVTHESISGIKNSWNELKNVFFLWYNFLHKISSLEKELKKEKKPYNKKYLKNLSLELYVNKHSPQSCCFISYKKVYKN